MPARKSNSIPSHDLYDTNMKNKQTLAMFSYSLFGWRDEPMYSLQMNLNLTMGPQTHFLQTDTFNNMSMTLVESKTTCDECIPS